MGGRPTPVLIITTGVSGSHTRTLRQQTYQSQNLKTNHESPRDEYPPERHQISHTYLVINKRKLKNKQTSIPLPPPGGGKLGRYILRASPPPKRHNTLCCITEYRDQHQANWLTFIQVPSYG